MIIAIIKKNADKKQQQDKYPLCRKIRNEDKYHDHDDQRNLPVIRLGRPSENQRTVTPGLPALLMLVDFQVHDVIPDVAIDMDEDGCYGSDNEQRPVST